MPQRRSNPDEFSASAERLFGKLQSYEAEGLSGRAQLRRLRSEGFHISDAAFYRARRRIGEWNQAASRLRHSRRNFRPRREQIPVNPFVRRGNYQWIIEIEGTAVNGVVIRETITVTSRRPQTRQWVERRAAEVVERAKEAYGIDRVTRVKIVQVFRRPERTRRR